MWDVSLERDNSSFSTDVVEKVIILVAASQHNAAGRHDLMKTWQ